MPHNACTIILNGHGCYSPDKIVNILSHTNDYSLFFPCSYRESITVSHHNLILADLATCSKDQIITRLQVMELPQTTSIINKQAWGNGKLQVDFDIEEAHVDVLANFAQANSVLSASNILSIRPTAPQDQKATFVLSDLISTTIPRIKIFASKHPDGSAEVLPYVFLDDRQDSTQNFIDMVTQSPIFWHQGDQLHELTIAGDACREL